MSALRLVTLTAPSHWASFLINHDASGLGRAEASLVEEWLHAEGLPFPVSCEDEGFLYSHDARDYTRGGADCQRYAFLV